MCRLWLPQLEVAVALRMKTTTPVAGHRVRRQGDNTQLTHNLLMLTFPFRAHNGTPRAGAARRVNRVDRRMNARRAQEAAVLCRVSTPIDVARILPSGVHRPSWIV